MSAPLNNDDAARLAQAQAQAVSGKGPAFLPDFKSSTVGTMGIELELMVLDRLTYDLFPAAPDILRILDQHDKRRLITDGPRPRGHALVLLEGAAELAVDGLEDLGADAGAHHAPAAYSQTSIDASYTARRRSVRWTRGRRAGFGAGGVMPTAALRGANRAARVTSTSTSA